MKQPRGWSGGRRGYDSNNPSRDEINDEDIFVNDAETPSAPKPGEPKISSSLPGMRKFVELLSNDGLNQTKSADFPTDENDKIKQQGNAEDSNDGVNNDEDAVAASEDDESELDEAIDSGFLSSYLKRRQPGKPVQGVDVSQSLIAFQPKSPSVQPKKPAKQISSDSSFINMNGEIIRPEQLASLRSQSASEPVTVKQNVAARIKQDWPPKQAAVDFKVSDSELAEPVRTELLVDEKLQWDDFFRAIGQVLDVEIPRRQKRVSSKPSVSLASTVSKESASSPSQSSSSVPSSSSRAKLEPPPPPPTSPSASASVATRPAAAGTGRHQFIVMPDSVEASSPATDQAESQGESVSSTAWSSTRKTPSPGQRLSPQPPKRAFPRRGEIPEPGRDQSRTRGGDRDRPPGQQIEEQGPASEAKRRNIKFPDLYASDEEVLEFIRNAHSDEKDFDFVLPSATNFKLHGTSSCNACRGEGVKDCEYCLGDGWLEPPLKMRTKGSKSGNDGGDEKISVDDLEMFRAELDTLRVTPAEYDYDEIWSRPDLVINSMGYAQCVFCNGLTKRYCSKCEGSGRSDRKGFNAYEEHREVFGYYPSYFGPSGENYERSVQDRYIDYTSFHNE